MKATLSLLVLTACVLVTAPFSSPAADVSRAIIVLDASGSMMGKIGERTKIDIAKAVIRDLLEDWHPDLHLGLMVYGHRRKGDCTDIELIIPPGKVDPQAVLKVVNAILPVGKTPLTDAVVQAAEVLKYEEEKATVILVSDGIETCGKDPEAAAEKLAALGVDFKAHVIGFDLTEEQQAKIRSFADKTGGMFLAAKDADTLKTAIFTAVQKAAEPEPEPAPPTSGTVRVRPLLAENGQEANAFLYFYKPPATPDGKRQTVKTGSRKTQQLEPGKYVVRAVWGKAEAEAEFSVEAGKELEVPIVLNAGILRATALYKEGGEPVKVHFYIKSGKADLKGRRTGIESGRGPSFKLPAGAYQLSAVYGKATATEDIEIKPGETTEITLILNAGVLRMKARASAEGEEVKAYYYVHSATKNLEGKRTLIASSAGDFELSAGKYLVTADWGNAKASKEVEVKAGEATEEVIILNAGVLDANATDAQGNEIKAYFYVSKAAKNLEGKRQGITSSAKGGWKLPAGKYHIMARKDKVTGEAEAEVLAGQRTSVTIKIGDGEE